MEMKIYIQAYAYVCMTYLYTLLSNVRFGWLDTLSLYVPHVEWISRFSSLPRARRSESFFIFSPPSSYTYHPVPNDKPT